MTRREIIDMRKINLEQLSDNEKIEIIKWRYNMLSAMQFIISSMNNEEANMSWNKIRVPDKITEKDYHKCADDYEDFEEQMQKFKMLMENYADEGFSSHNIHSTVADEKVDDYIARMSVEFIVANGLDKD